MKTKGLEESLIEKITHTAWKHVSSFRDYQEYLATVFILKAVMYIVDEENMEDEKRWLYAIDLLSDPKYLSERIECRRKDNATIYYKAAVAGKREKEIEGCAMRILLSYMEEQGIIGDNKEA